MQIRRAHPEDYEQMLGLNAELHQFHVIGTQGFFKPFEPEMFSPEFYQRWLENPAAHLLVAEEGGELVGYLYAEVRELPETPIRYAQRYIEVEELGVTEKFRSQGVGEQLYRELEKIAFDLGLKRISLSVWAFNRRAEAFYERLGFEQAQLRLWKSL